MNEYAAAAFSGELEKIAGLHRKGNTLGPNLKSGLPKGKFYVMPSGLDDAAKTSLKGLIDESVNSLPVDTTTLKAKLRKEFGNRSKNLIDRAIAIRDSMIANKNHFAGKPLGQAEYGRYRASGDQLNALHEELVRTEPTRVASKAAVAHELRGAPLPPPPLMHPSDGGGPPPGGGSGGGSPRSGGGSPRGGGAHVPSKFTWKSGLGVGAGLGALGLGAYLLNRREDRR